MNYQDEINLINFFTRNKNLTREQRARFNRLVAIDLGEKGQRITSHTGVETLLEIWEKDGLDAAVKEWKKSLLESSKKKLSKQKRESQDSNVSGQSFHVKDIPQPLQEEGIDHADFDEIKSEIEALKNTIKNEKNDTGLSYGFLWDDIPFLESGEP